MRWRSSAVPAQQPSDTGSGPNEHQRTGHEVVDDASSCSGAAVTGVDRPDRNLRDLTTGVGVVAAAVATTARSIVVTVDCYGFLVTTDVVAVVACVVLIAVV